MGITTGNLSNSTEAIIFSEVVENPRAPASGRTSDVNDLRILDLQREKNTHFREMGKGIQTVYVDKYARKSRRN